MNQFPAGESPITLQGPQGNLQAITTCSKKAEETGTNVTIVCHPHSLMGGTMNNKVVHTVARARRDLGHRVVRFNFRGVEKSEGAYSDGVGEQDDLLAVIDWVRQVRPDDRIHLAGFSFGAYVSAATCQRALERGDPIGHLLLIAPAVENYPFQALRAFGCPLQVIYGDSDEVVDSTAMARWAESVQSAREIECLAGAGHFFHGRLTDVKHILEQS